MLRKMGMLIELTRAARERILDEARRAFPAEACGLLFGQEGRIERVEPARNVHPTPQTHFEIDPQALVDAQRAARDGGPGLIGHYHSHPTNRAEPSATDRRHAAGDGSIWAIVAGDDVAFWLDGEDGFTALSYSLADR
jgi:proteasome lid subunit RPN8/RPN11